MKSKLGEMQRGAGQCQSQWRAAKSQSGKFTHFSFFARFPLGPHLLRLLKKCWHVIRLGFGFGFEEGAWMILVFKAPTGALYVTMCHWLAINSTLCFFAQPNSRASQVVTNNSHSESLLLDQCYGKAKQFYPMKSSSKLFSQSVRAQVPNLPKIVRSFFPSLLILKHIYTKTNKPEFLKG